MHVTILSLHFIYFAPAILSLHFSFRTFSPARLIWFISQPTLILGKPNSGPTLHRDKLERTVCKQHANRPLIVDLPIISPSWISFSISFPSHKHNSQLPYLSSPKVSYLTPLRHHWRHGGAASPTAPRRCRTKPTCPAPSPVSCRRLRSLVLPQENGVESIPSSLRTTVI